MMVMHWKKFGLPLLLALATAGSFAADKDHATLLREEYLRASAGTNSQQLSQVNRGTDLTVLETSNADGQPWMKVSLAADQAEVSKEVTGWLPGKTIVNASTTNGDQIVFGQAVDSERQAEERGGRKGAAQDALRLYSRVAELFPGSPLAAEAMWRAADIRWQLAKADRSGAPPQEKYLQEVITKFPQSKQAELAAFDLLDSKLCPEWRGLADCPTKESVLYEQYAHEHPQSPKAAEALFDAAWRQASLVDIYRLSEDRAKSEAARKKAVALAQEIQNQYPQGDWKPRAMDLVFKLEKKIPQYGPAEE
jgi:Bacterial SH3 domain